MASPGATPSASRATPICSGCSRVPRPARRGPPSGNSRPAEAAGRTHAVHRGVAAAARANAGRQFRNTVDTEVAAFWGDGLKFASGADGNAPYVDLTVRAGLAAVPYLIRQARWHDAAYMLERAFTAHPTRANAAAVLAARSCREADGSVPYPSAATRPGIPAGVLANLTGALSIDIHAMDADGSLAKKVHDLQENATPTLKPKWKVEIPPEAAGRTECLFCFVVKDAHGGQIKSDTLFVSRPPFHFST